MNLNNAQCSTESSNFVEKNMWLVFGVCSMSNDGNYGKTLIYRDKWLILVSKRRDPFTSAQSNNQLPLK